MKSKSILYNPVTLLGADRETLMILNIDNETSEAASGSVSPEKLPAQSVEISR